MKYLILSAVLLAGCAQQPNGRSTEAGNAGIALVNATILKECPRHIKVKDDRRAYYNNRLAEGRRLLGKNYWNASMDALVSTLRAPGGCANLANGYMTIRQDHPFLTAR